MSSSVATEEPVVSDGSLTDLDGQIQAAQHRIRKNDFLTAIVGCAAAVLAYVLVFTLIDHWLIPGGFAVVTRAILLTGLVLGAAALSWKLLRRPVAGSVSALFAARVLDQETRARGSLEAYVDLKSADSGLPSGVQRSLEGRAVRSLTDLRLDEVLDRSLLIRLGLILFALVLATSLYSVFSPKPISFLRPLTLVSQDVATRTRIVSVSPGDITIGTGRSVNVHVDISGHIPEQVQVLVTTQDQRLVDAPITMEPADDSGRFEATLAGESVRGIRQAMTYRIQAGDATSDQFTISVSVPPTASVRAVHCRYPRYMKLPDLRTAATSIDVWEGTEVEIHAEATAPIRDARLELCADRNFASAVTTWPADVSGTDIVTTFAAELPREDSPPRFYRVVVVAPDGQSDSAATVYPLQIRPDQPPTIELLDPVGPRDVPANAVVPLLIRASDPDFMLRSLTLRYAVNGQQIEPGEIIRDFQHSDEGFRPDWSGSWRFQLAPLGLRPGDVVRYSVEARDNHAPGLGRAARTTPMELHITGEKSPASMERQLAEEEQQQQQLLDQLTRNESDQSNPAEQTDDWDTDGAADSPEGNIPENDSPQHEEDSAATSPDDSGDAAQQPNDNNSSDSQSRSGNLPGSENSPQSGDGTQESESSQPPTENSNSDSPTSQTPPDHNDDDVLQEILKKYQDKAASDQNQQKQPSTQQDGDSPPADTGTPPGEQGTAESRRPGTEDPAAAEHQPPQPEEQSNDRPQQPGPEEPDNGTNASGDSGKQTKSPDAGQPDPDMSSDANNKNEAGTPTGNTRPSSRSGDNESDSNKQATDSTGEGAEPTNRSPGQPGSDSELSGANESGSSSNGRKSGGSESGGSESGGSESGGSESGGSESGGSESGGSESGGSESGGSESGGSGGSSGGPAGTSNGKGMSTGGDSTGGNSNGQPTDAPPGDAPPQFTDDPIPASQQQQGTRKGPGEGGGLDEDAPASPPNEAADLSPDADTPAEERLQDRARAVSLALDQLQRDLSRGEADEQLLKELGWTPQQLQRFVDRMQTDLQQLEQTKESRAEQLQQQRVQELLRSLDLAGGTGRRGTQEFEQERQTTTIRRRSPPARFRERHDQYQKDLNRRRRSRNSR